MAAKTHKLELVKGSVMILRQIVAGAQWAETATDTYRASEVVEGPLQIDIGDPPKDEKSLKAFGLEPVTIELTEKQRDTVKKCVEVHCKRGAFFAGKPILVLLKELGLAPEE